MQDKIELAKPRAFGELIEDSILFFKRNWKPLMRSYIIICGFFWVAGLAISLFNVNQTAQRVAMGESRFGYTYFLSLGFSLVSHVVIILTATCYIAVYKDKGNEPGGVDEVWSYVKYYFFRVAGSYLALLALICAGTLFFLIPGIYFAIVVSITIPIMVIENSTLGYAFSRSFVLMKNRWWQTLGIIIVSELIILAAMLSVGIPVGLIVWGTKFLTNFKSNDITLYATAIITHVFQFLYILPLIVITLTYFSYNEEADQGRLFERIEMIGKNQPDTAGQLTEEY